MRTTLFILATLAAACTPGDKPPVAVQPAEGITVQAESASIHGVPANCFKRSSDKIGAGPFRLTSHTGSPTTQDTFHGQKTFVFFGFTHCPDICPITLYNLGKAITLLPPNVKKPRTVFISVDPARDTPEAMEQYIRSNGFPEDIVGLTGSLDELQQVSDAFVAPFSREEEAEGPADSTAGYVVSHSSILYLMDENWKLETFFMQGESPADIAACYAALG